MSVDPLDRLARYEASVTALNDSQNLLERARSLWELGVAVRHVHGPRAAREPLRHALDLAHRCSSRRLEQAVHAELVACGARPRRRSTTGRDALTPAERRVAGLAVAGMSNRDIAQHLFLTVKTVETHLGRVYAKLGIPGRRALAAALDAER